MNFKKLENLIDALPTLYGIPNCDCSVYYKHKEVFRRRAGFVDQEKTKPVSEHDLYFLYSASKVILAVASMQLVEKGLISLSDPVCKYLPEYGKMLVKQGDTEVPCEKQATIEELLSMRGGLNYANTTPGARPDMEEMQRNNPEASTQEFIHQWLQTSLDFEPGTHFLYSMCLDVMAAVIEVVTGQKYRDYVRENIAIPLGMKDFAMSIREIDPDRMVQQYAYNPFAQGTAGSQLLVPFDKLHNVAIFGPNYDSGGGGVITTVSDYVLLADALANDGVGANEAKILTRESIDNMRTNRLTTPQMFLDHAHKMQDYGYGYGLGVRTLVDPRGSKSPVGEFGWDGLGGAYFLSDVENHIAIFYLMSVTSMINVKSLVHHKLRDFTYEALEEEIKNEKT